MAKEKKDNIRNSIEREWPSAKAFGTILPDYMITPDSTFTRERTGAGDIEYFNEPYIDYRKSEKDPLNIIYNPNGSTPTLLYSPQNNSVDDVKLDLLHHYRAYDPVYRELLEDYTKTQNKGDILWNSQLGEIFREQYPKDSDESRAAWIKMVQDTPNTSQYIVQGIDGSLRNLLAKDETIATSNYAPRKVAEQQYLSTPEAQSTFNIIKQYLESNRLPEVVVTPNSKEYGGSLSTSLDWDKLSMRDRAAYIRNAVSRGINTPLDIRNDYNEFKGGGKKNSGNRKKVFLNSLQQSLNGYSRYNTPQWRKFLTDLALQESSYNANALNSIGAKGYFQLMPSNRSATWSNPVQQFHEMYKLSDSNMEYFRKNLTKDDIHRAESMGIDIYGLMAGAHLGGVGNAIKALRGQGNAKDINNSSVLGYMKKFSQTSNNTPVLTDSKVMKMPTFEYTETPVIPAQQAAMITENPIIQEPIAMGTIQEEPSIQQTIPEVVVTPKPRYQDDSQEILQQLSKLMIPYKTIDLPKPITATERLAQINENRNTLLQKDLENNIIRNSLLGNYDNNRLRRDVEDLQFYRNMSAFGGNLYATGSSMEDEATQNEQDFDKYYNAGSAGLGVAGSMGAADLFRNTRLNYPYIDRVLDAAGVIQNAGDFLKFGYDTYNSYQNSKDKKALGGNLFPKGGPIIKVNPGDRVFTDQCALWSNSLLRDNGYLINGNAWNLGNVDLLYNGFEGLDRPETYDSKAVMDYNHQATQNVFKNFDSKTLDTKKPYVVNMFYNNSPSQETAYNEGDGVTGTHTGLLTYDPDTKKWWVTHNIHGNIHQEPFIDLQKNTGKYGVTAIYAPRPKTVWNRVKGFFGFEDGGQLMY